MWSWPLNQMEYRDYKCMEMASQLPSMSSAQETLLNIRRTSLSPSLYRLHLYLSLPHPPRLNTTETKTRWKRRNITVRGGVEITDGDYLFFPTLTSYLFSRLYVSYTNLPASLSFPAPSCKPHLSSLFFLPSCLWGTPTVYTQTSPRAYHHHRYGPRDADIAHPIHSSTFKKKKRKTPPIFCLYKTSKSATGVFGRDVGYVSQTKRSFPM